MAVKSRRTGKTISVSWSSAQGQYRKYVGFQQGRDGEPRPKCWYLGTDEREAIRRTVELLAEWNRLKRAGASAWPLRAADQPLGGRAVNRRVHRQENSASRSMGRVTRASMAKP
jgi:hypothetical protein